MDDKRKERRGKEKRCGNKIKTEILLPLIYISKSSSEAKKMVRDLLIEKEVEVERFEKIYIQMRVVNFNIKKSLQQEICLKDFLKSNFRKFSSLAK